MCGILAILGDEICDEYIDKLKKLIDARGPDYSSPISACTTGCGLNLRVTASVLHLRGKQIAEQPVVDQDGNILLFNGQIYEYDGNDLEQDISDTIFLSERLSECLTKADIAGVLSKIDGPFAVIYWSNSLKCLLYGRDFFGRKSLCTLQSNSESLVPALISSVGSSIDEKSQTWQEVDPRGFHCLDFSLHAKGKRSCFMWDIDHVYPRTEKCRLFELDSSTDEGRVLQAPISKLNQDLRTPDEFEGHSLIDSIVENLEKSLLSAVEQRLRFNNDLCLMCRQQMPSQGKCNHSKVALAFSGGIDSTVLALALHRVIPESETIDLITVAFKDESPDRFSVGEAFKELRLLCPRRNWRLVICDISLAELQSERARIIRHLILPSNTVVDDGLGCGCWFISRARGRSLDSSIRDDELDNVYGGFLKYDPTNSVERVANKINITYESPASMLFAGMGIDEQLGGYTSHRAAWSKGKTRGVLDEIAFQMRRIPTRNLGRDDRTFSHHGRDVKLPFLAYNFVSFLNETPVGLKMNLTEPQEIGPKKSLRKLAQLWGLNETSVRVKRALQFGTRIACLEDASEKGGDICSRLD